MPENANKRKNIDAAIGNIYDSAFHLKHIYLKRQHAPIAANNNASPFPNKQYLYE